MIFGIAQPITQQIADILVVAPARDARLHALANWGNDANVRLFVGVTDSDWFELLAAQPRLEEVNFSQPGGNRQFKALEPGERPSPALLGWHSENVFLG